MYEHTTPGERCYIEKRSDKTLSRWFDELNRFDWPDALLPLEDPNVPGRPRRQAMMDFILKTIGWRQLRRIRNKRS